MAEIGTDHERRLPFVLRSAQANADILAKLLLLGIFIALVAYSAKLILETAQSKEYLAAAFERSIDHAGQNEGRLGWQVGGAIAAMLLNIIIAVAVADAFHRRVGTLVRQTGARIWYLATVVVLALVAWPFVAFGLSIMAAHTDVVVNLPNAGAAASAADLRDLSQTRAGYVGAVAACLLLGLLSFAAHLRWPSAMRKVAFAACGLAILLAGTFHVIASYGQPDLFRWVGGFALLFAGGSFVWALVYMLWAVPIPDSLRMMSFGLVAILLIIKAWHLERTAFTPHTTTDLVKFGECTPRAREFLALERRFLDETGLSKIDGAPPVDVDATCGKAAPPPAATASEPEYFQQRRMTRSIATTFDDRPKEETSAAIGEQYLRNAEKFFGIPPVDRKIEAWLDARLGDIERTPEGQSYRLLIATAQGGGLYAAYHAAVSLARMQDECPHFARQLFAISAVSGGGIGAQLFSDLAYHGLRSTGGAEPARPAGARCRSLAPGEQGPYGRAVEAFFRNDYQAPLLGTLLYADSPLLVLPRWLTRTDRATALGWSFDSGWDRLWRQLPDLGLETVRKGSLGPTRERHYFADQAVRSHEAPTTIINAALANNGMPVILAPFYFSNFYGRVDNPQGWAYYRFAHFFDLLPGVELPLTSAVLLGARFPYVTPGARFPVSLPSRRWLYKNSSDVALADGGYYDNTGTATALALAARIEHVLSKPASRYAAVRERIKIELVRMVDSTREGFLTVDRSPDELQLPLVTLYQTRSFTRDFYISMMHHKAAPPYNLTFDAVGIPLSWQLSRATRKKIEADIGKDLVTEGKGLNELRSALN